MQHPAPPALVPAGDAPLPPGMDGVRLQEILAAGPVVLYLLDSATGGVRWMSGNITRLFGYPVEEALKPGWWWRNVHPEDRERFGGPDGHGTPHGEGRREYRFRHADGGYRWVLDETVLVKGDGGEPREVVGSWTDVTARRQAEEALVQSERDYRRLFEMAQDCITILDPCTEEILEANSRACEVYGYAREELVGRSMRQLTADPERGKARIRETLERGTQHHFETVHFRSDGSEILLEINAGVVEYRGRPAILSVNRDITARRHAETALRRSEERFRRLFDHAAASIFVHDAEGRILDVNARACSSLGYGRDELLRMTVAEVEAGPHPDGSRLRELASMRGRPVSASGRHRRKDGSTFPVDLRLALFDDEDGRPVFLALANDATERLRSEAALRESEALFRAVFTRAAVGMFLAGADGTLRQANPVFQAMLGYPEDELRGRRISSVTLAADRERSAAAFERLVAGEMDAYGIEKRFVRRDGGVIWVHQTLSVVRGAAGAPELVIGVIEDVSDRRAAEESVRRSEKHFRSLIARARDGVTVLGADLSVRYVSPAASEVLGFGAAEITGTHAASFVAPEDVPALERLLAEVMERPEGTGSGEFRVRHRDGGWRVLEAVATNWLHDPDIAGVVVNSRDVTERRQAERALQESEQRMAQMQKMEAVGRLAGGVAHDFNNMLTAIRGNAHLALMELPPGAPVRADVEEIERASARAAELTGQLLAFSRRQVLQPREISLNARVSEITPMLRRLIGEDIELVSVLDPELLPVRADPGQVEQVVLNLAVNARDAMPGGGVLRMETRNVRVERTLSRGAFAIPPGRYVSLLVGDTGTGMGEDVLSHVFEPFFTTKPPGKGTGLGLSTVYGIVKQSGGYIWVESQPGAGTRFHVYLPGLESAAGEAAPAPLAVPAPGSETILLVEDEDAVRAVARKFLARSGYRVLDAASAEEGVRLFERHADEIALVVTDVVMPGTGGRAFARDLLRVRPGLPVLYVSGYMEDAVFQPEVLAPGEAFLAKPFTSEALAGKVREVLDARSRG